MTRRHLLGRGPIVSSILIVVITAAVVASLPAAVAVAGSPSEYGLEGVTAAIANPTAGAHSDVSVKFAIKQDPSSPADFNKNHEPYATTRDVKIAMPPGLLGSLNAVTQCTPEEFFSTNFDASGAAEAAGCPLSSQVGTSRVVLYSIKGSFIEPIYLLTPGPTGVARLGLFAQTVPLFVNVRVRSTSSTEDDYGLTASLEGLASNARLLSSDTTLWGVPGAASHNTKRLLPFESANQKSSSPSRPFGRPEEPFLSNPTECGVPLQFSISADSYQIPGSFSTLQAPVSSMSDCGGIDFAPTLSVSPTVKTAETPTGLEALLKIPQDETPDGRATAQLRNASVTLPDGMGISASAGDGLQACDATQVGYLLPHAAECPDASKIGTATFDVPALPRPIHGAIYQRTPEPGHLFHIWLAADEQGAHVVLPGEIQADPRTGQITSVFVDNPQVPLRELQLKFRSGPRAPLVTPANCGSFATTYRFDPWSGGNPTLGESKMTIDGGCPDGTFSPAFAAGTTNSAAGAFAGFTMNLSRTPGQQNISGLEVTFPPGLLAKLGGVPLCGAAEATTGACPAGSKIGTTTVAAGPGPNPLWVPQPGKDPTAVYLGGPYKGAPYSAVVKVPAEAGPFNLGTVVVRAALEVDPTTTQATVKSDPLPQFLEGVPVSYRDINVAIDRPGFTLNPTDCEPLAVGATVSGSLGAIAHPSDRFQVGGCKGLGFKPKLKFFFRGQTKRIGHPRFKAVLTQPGGQANIARVSTLLPKTEFIDPQHIGNVCTRVQFAVEACPKKSILGTAKAWTPLLDQPLEGKVYFRSNGSERELPDIVAALRGAIDVNLVGWVDSVKKKGSESSRVRNIFNSVPDAPVSKFVIELNGGKQGLLQNSRDLCKSKNSIDLKMRAQNGRTLESHQRVSAPCGKKSKKGSGKKK